MSFCNLIISLSGRSVWKCYHFFLLYVLMRNKNVSEEGKREGWEEVGRMRLSGLAVKTVPGSTGIVADSESHSRFRQCRAVSVQQRQRRFE